MGERGRGGSGDGELLCAKMRVNAPHPPPPTPTPPIHAAAAQGEWVCEGCVAGRAPPPRRAATARDRFLQRQGLGLARIEDIWRDGDGGELHCMARWYCVPEETHTGRQVSSGSRSSGSTLACSAWPLWLPVPGDGTLGLACPDCPAAHDDCVLACFVARRPAPAPHLPPPPAATAATVLQRHHLAREVFLTPVCDANPLDAALRPAHVLPPRDFAAGGACSRLGEDVFVCEYQYDAAWQVRGYVGGGGAGRGGSLGWKRPGREWLLMLLSVQA